MAHPSTPPKFEKKSHHVVPAGWQRRFFAMDAKGQRATVGYYKDITSGKCLGPIGVGDRMAEEYANIVFDAQYRPSDELEDRLAKDEGKAISALDRVVATKSIGPNERIDVAYLLGLQASRYPELYDSRLDLAKYLAIAFAEVDRFASATDFSDWVRLQGLLPGVALSATEFANLAGAREDRRDRTVDAILAAHGYEAHFNPGLVIDGALRVAEHLTALQWDLLEVNTPSFILSDRPLPARNLGYAFSVALTDCFALKLAYPQQPVTDTTVIASRPAQASEIDAVNREVRGRALRWICGPSPWIRSW